MDCGCDQAGLMPLEVAQQRIWHSIKPIKETEICRLESLIDRVLFEDVISPIAVPGFDNSAMDGYAIRHDDAAIGAELRVIGKSFAGSPFEGDLMPGQCVRIMTGAKIPNGADTVIMQENTEAVGDTVQLTTMPKPGENIRRKGEDIAQHALVLPARHQISAIDIGLLASIGIAHAKVFRKLTVALFSTGNELTQPGNPLKEGCIYDSNRPALHSLLVKMGVSVIDYGAIEDDKERIRETLQQADKEADVIITTGGVSVGEADFTREVIEELGTINFWKLAIKPGKPLAYGQLPNSYFFGLPGNPVSAMVTFYQIAMPHLQRLMGRKQSERQRITATTASSFKKSPGRTDFQRGLCYKGVDNTFYVEPLSNQSSGVLSSLSRANCFVILEQDRGPIKAGEQVIVEWFDHTISN